MSQAKIQDKMTSEKNEDDDENMLVIKNEETASDIEMSDDETSEE